MHTFEKYFIIIFKQIEILQKNVNKIEFFKLVILVIIINFISVMTRVVVL